MQLEHCRPLNSVMFMLSTKNQNFRSRASPNPLGRRHRADCRSPSRPNRLSLTRVELNSRFADDALQTRIKSKAHTCGPSDHHYKTRFEPQHGRSANHVTHPSLSIHPLEARTRVKTRPRHLRLTAAFARRIVRLASRASSEETTGREGGQ